MYTPHWPTASRSLDPDFCNQCLDRSKTQPEIKYSTSFMFDELCIYLCMNELFLPAPDCVYFMFVWHQAAHGFTWRELPYNFTWGLPLNHPHMLSFNIMEITFFGSPDFMEIEWHRNTVWLVFTQLKVSNSLLPVLHGCGVYLRARSSAVQDLMRHNKMFGTTSSRLVHEVQTGKNLPISIPPVETL